MDSTVTRLQEWFLKEDNDSVVKNEDLPQMFAKQVAAQIGADTREADHTIFTVWMDMGLSTQDMMNRMKEIKLIHWTANRNALKTDTSRLKRLIQYTDSKLSQIDVILADLTLPSFRAPTGLSRKELGRILVYKFSELEALKKGRLNQLKQLKSKRDKLLKNMNMKAKELRTATNIPSDEELMHLQSYVLDLTKELSKRFNKYKKIIEELFKELERDVNLDFEKHLLFEGSDDLILSDDHMKRLATLHSSLETCYQQNEDKRKEMEKRLDSLWNKLEVEQSYRDAFYRNKNGCKPSVLALLADEVNKYEELKRQNIEVFIEKVRQELEEWYEKCYTSDEERDKFQEYFDCNELTEDLLDLHEKELQRLQNHFNECEEMFDRLLEWHNLWERYQELENKANDPNRFNNRGGALLAEEREKNAIKKKLPKVENTLKKLSEERHQQKGQHFEVFGNAVKQYLENQKMEYQDMKENEKKERQRLKQMEKNGGMKGGPKSTPVCGVVLRRTPVKRGFTPASPGRNGDSNSKVRRIGGPLTPSREMNSRAQTNRPVVGREKPVPRARARNLEAQMNQMLETNISASVLSINEEQFQAPLTDRDYGNSTFISTTQRPQSPTRNVTKRREPKANAIHRRLSRSCNDLTEATKKMHLATTRSTPASPQPKSAYGATPSRLPRIAVGQRKKPFLPF